VHFEIIEARPAGVAEVLWRPVRVGVRHDCPGGGSGLRSGNYVFVDRYTTSEGTGIRGGVCGGAGYDTRAIFYVGVPDA